jgi:hypothetical protein
MVSTVNSSNTLSNRDQVVIIGFRILSRLEINLKLNLGGLSQASATLRDMNGV